MSINNPNSFLNIRTNKAICVGSPLVPKNFIGIEIEIEGKALFRTPFRYWKVVDDGSLRNTPGGSAPCEYVLEKPLPRSKLEDALVYLNLSSKRADIDTNSTRTSTHIHINVSDMLWIEVLTFVCLYYVVEDLLVEYAGPTRPGNLFCLRTRDAKTPLFTIQSAIINNCFNYLNTNDIRYASCNLTSIFKYGSLEFRAFRGTMDSNAILEWIDILLELKTSAEMFRSPQDILSLFEENNSNPSIFLKKIFPRFSHLFEQTNYYQRVWDGIRNIRDIVLALTKAEKDVKF